MEETMDEEGVAGGARFGLYLITDGRAVGGDDRGLLGGIEEALEGGARAVQLREKELNCNDCFKLAKSMRALTSSYGAMLFINDRVDVAMAVGANGVHLGQGSIKPEEARELIGEEKLIGVSTHSLAEAKAAASGGADFITMGPVFTTPSKLKYGEPIGSRPLKEAAGEIKIPVYAIGGIKKVHIEEVMGAGAAGVALISAILSSKNIDQDTEEIIKEIEQYR